jgi:hypothetical protein
MKRLNISLIGQYMIGLTTVFVSLHCTYSAQAQENGPTRQLELVKSNAEDQPRHTPVTRAAMKQYLEDLKYRVPRIPLPELSEAEKKRALEDPRAGTYESRLRANYLSDSVNAYLTFGGSPARGFPNSPGRPNNPPDPKLSLDYAFKVRMFWIAARANNCQYCLGHQESKLLSAGMSEDQIAALDSDWSLYPEKEQVAFALAKRLTNQPYLVSDEDIQACRKFYDDLQIIEMVGSIAGNNAINRWKEGAGIPQSSNGGNFGTAPGSSISAGQANQHSYLTNTDAKYAQRSSIVAVLDSDHSSAQTSAENQSAPTVYSRPPLESGAELAEKLSWVEQRKPRLPLLDEEAARKVLGDLAESGPIPQWQRLLAHFPVAGRRLVEAVAASKQSDEIDHALQAKIDWLVARQDGAWYMAALAKQQLEQLGVDERELQALEGDLQQLDQRQRTLLLVAKNLAASPIVLTDKQVAQAVQVAGAKAVTQVINYTCYRASLDRITEAAGLSLQN